MMAEPAAYCESGRRNAIHAAVGAGVVASGFALGAQGVGLFVIGLGALFLLGGSWGLLRRALGRVDRLVLSDDALTYVNPVRPSEDRKVPLSEVVEVKIDTGMVGRVKELQVSVKLKDGRTWCFGERFMDARLLRRFVEDALERIRRLP
jgi:hypothetical protein